MNRPVIHSLIGTLGIVTILTFLSATLISEIFLDKLSVINVKFYIGNYGIYLLMIFMMITGLSGKILAKNRRGRLVNSKQKRMLIIALNGLLIMIPSAIFLNYKASENTFDLSFYTVQLIEVAVGFIQLYLMILNFKEGLLMSGKIKKT